MGYEVTEEAVAGGVPDAEAVARRGGPAAEITAEQRQSLYDFTLLQFPEGGRVESWVVSPADPLRIAP